MLSLSLPPALNDMYRPNFGNKKGVRKTDECEAWEQEVKLMARFHKPWPKETPVVMRVRIFYKFDRDIDSSQKALQDCLQGYMYENDSQIVELLITKEKDLKNPHLEVEVSAILP